MMPVGTEGGDCRSSTYSWQAEFLLLVPGSTLSFLSLKASLEQTKFLPKTSKLNLCVSFSPSDPNKGHSDVPVSWPAYTNKGKYYLEINNKINKNSVKQDLRSRFVTFWNSVYRQLPQVANISQAELMF